MVTAMSGNTHVRQSLPFACGCDAVTIVSCRQLHGSSTALSGEQRAAEDLSVLLKHEYWLDFICGHAHMKDTHIRRGHACGVQLRHERSTTSAVGTYAYMQPQVRDIAAQTHTCTEWKDQALK